jgi:hypothetical protein
MMRFSYDINSFCMVRYVSHIISVHMFLIWYTLYTKLKPCFFWCSSMYRILYLMNFSLISRRHHCRWSAAYAQHSGPLRIEGGIFIFTVTRGLCFLVTSDDRPIQSPLTTHLGMWRIYSKPDPHGVLYLMPYSTTQYLLIDKSMFSDSYCRGHVKIQERVDSLHPIACCKKRQQNGAGLQMRPEKPRPRMCHSRCSTIKIPPCLKAPSAENRPKFCSSLLVMY